MLTTVAAALKTSARPKVSGVLDNLFGSYVRLQGGVGEDICYLSDDGSTRCSINIYAALPADVHPIGKCVVNRDRSTGHFWKIECDATSPSAQLPHVLILVLWGCWNMPGRDVHVSVPCWVFPTKPILLCTSIVQQILEQL